MAKSNWRDVPARKKRAPGEVEAACRAREVAGGKDWVPLAWTWVWWLGPPRDRQGVWAGLWLGWWEGDRPWLWVGFLGRVALGGVLGRGWDMALGGLLGRGSDVALGGLLGEGSEVPVGGGGGGLLGTASALVLGGAMVLGGVTLGMGLMAGRGAVGSEEPVAVAALPGGYFGGVGNFGLLRPGGSSATEACTVHFKDKRVHRTCITVYGVRAQVYIYIGTCI